VAITATNHAKLYGLYPRKGTIAVGSDADIVLWDPAREQTISQKILHHGADYTPYEGLRVKGWPTRVMLRGKIIVEDGRVLGNAGDGAFLKRERSNAAQPSERL
jgi:dihydropyrimidinase